MIYILEDNEERVRQFRDAVAKLSPCVEVVVWRNANLMITDLLEGLEDATLISLDHDLNELDGDDSDPGTGYDVAKFLEELIPCCPVIIHTSNGERGIWMEGSLMRAGWRYERVYPFDDDWIEKDWLPRVIKLIS